MDVGPQFQRLLARLDYIHRVGIFFQGTRDKAGNLVFVFDQENAHTAFAHIIAHLRPAARRMSAGRPGGAPARRIVQCTSKTRISALVVSCCGTATKYRFSSGTRRAVFPSGPVGIVPSSL